MTKVWADGRISGAEAGCRVCKAPLTKDNWTKSLRSSRRYICSPCWSARQLRYYRNDPDGAKKKFKQSKARKESWDADRRETERRKGYNRKLLKRYGISIEDFDALMIKQRGRCAICNDALKPGRDTHVDHNHKTGIARGILCANCNRLIGMAHALTTSLRHELLEVRNTSMSGQKTAFTSDQVFRLEALFREEGLLRDEALWRVGKDTALRSSDLLSLTVGDVRWSGGIRDVLTLKQQKTGRTVKCCLSGSTRAVLARYIGTLRTPIASTRLFAFTTAWYRKLVKNWCEMLRMDGCHYSTHSVRRTLPTHVYKHTKDLAACQQLLGHASPAATVRYINMDAQLAHELVAAVRAEFPI